MRKLFFIIFSLTLFTSACELENRHKEPGIVRNDTIYDPQYIVNENRRDTSFEEVAQKADYKFCIDSSKIDRDAICIESYEPVCGCDGRTYANSCKAEKVGIVSYTQGPCKDEAIK